jgi:hypothetical protein
MMNFVWLVGIIAGALLILLAVGCLLFPLHLFDGFGIIFGVLGTILLFAVYLGRQLAALCV